MGKIQMSKTVILITKITCALGHEQEFTFFVKWGARESRKEPGCQAFTVCKDSKVERCYHFHEIYNDQAAVDAHKETPHCKALMGLVEAGKVEMKMDVCNPYFTDEFEE